jgi:hypothetical protein
VTEDEQARIVVDARDDQGGFLNGLDLQVSVVSDDTDRSSTRLPLRQTAPGRYEATFNPEDEGAYFLFVTNRADSGDDTAALDLNQTSGWVRSYSPEYQVREFDDGLLQAIADLTNGTDLSATPEAVFAHNLDARSASVPIWPWLLLAAVLLLPVDIAVRRLLVTQSDLRRLRAWVGGQLRPEHSEAATERMTTLKEARDRARVRADSSAERVGSAAASISQLRQRREEQADETPSPPVQPVPRPSSTPRSQPPVKQPEPSTETGNIGARLLKKRQEREEE